MDQRYLARIQPGRATVHDAAGETGRRAARQARPGEHSCQIEEVPEAVAKPGFYHRGKYEIQQAVDSFCSHEFGLEKLGWNVASVDKHRSSVMVWASWRTYFLALRIPDDNHTNFICKPEIANQEQILFSTFLGHSKIDAALGVVSNTGRVRLATLPTTEARTMLSAICLAAFMLASPSDVPKVDLDFNTMTARDWKGKRFSEILPADQIKQIGRLVERGFARDAGPSNEQAAYDAFLTHLLDSPVTANDWSLGGNEGPLAELLVLTKDGRLLHIEVIGTARVPTAIILHAKGHGARIDVKDFKYPEQKK